MRFNYGLLVFSLIAVARPCATTLDLNLDPGAVFTGIYEHNAWSSAGGGSGAGSTLDYTRHVRNLLFSFITRRGVKTMVDAPCGSFHWMPMLLERLEHANETIDDYTGLDVVHSIIEASNITYVNRSSWHFRVADLTKDDLPTGKDLILSRDALQHLSLEQVKLALKAYQRAAPRYLLVGSYPSNTENRDIATGDYNAINLMRPPFDLWPEEVFSEETPDHKHLLLFTQEQIALWKL